MLTTSSQDDAFSSLDNEVVGWIFEKCIKLVSAKYKRTVILVTQKTQLVYSADYVSSSLLILKSRKRSEISHKKLTDGNSSSQMHIKSRENRVCDRFMADPENN